ncbi:hypothetical protein [Inediibacterium massiliense]|uniref:hypothetical protein n=1 Tax=Inediibacterium massiliense TaxID=1658111 RepID=UPI0006B60446|nr:hypothetical protein [Inediibacterium massiliense]
MNMIQDIYITNQKVLKKTIEASVKNWPIVFTGFVYLIISILLFRVAVLFGILGGILVGIVQNALLSNYLYLIENIIRYGKISIEDFKKGFTIYLWKIYGIFVVIWLVHYGIDLILAPVMHIKIGTFTLWTVIELVAFVFLNCILEVIYQRDESIGENFSYSFSFMKENFIDWWIPNILLGIMIYYILGQVMNINILMGNIPLSFSIKGVVLYIVGQFLISFTMVYRGFLFGILSTTTRRKRLFMRNMKN